MEEEYRRKEKSDIFGDCENDDQPPPPTHKQVVPHPFSSTHPRASHSFIHDHCSVAHVVAVCVCVKVNELSEKVDPSVDLVSVYGDYIAEPTLADV